MLLPREQTMARQAHPIQSMCDPGTLLIPLNPRWEAVLRLELSDFSWDGKNDPTPESLAEQAAALVALVHAHWKASLIVFHCHAGISRSRTAAAVVCQRYGWPYEWYPLHYAWEAALRTALAEMAKDGALAPILARLGLDITEHPERLKGFSRALVARIRQLTSGIPIDHTAAIEGVVAEMDAQIVHMQDPAVWEATRRGLGQDLEVRQPRHPENEPEGPMAKARRPRSKTPNGPIVAEERRRRGDSGGQETRRRAATAVCVAASRGDSG